MDKNKTITDIFYDMDFEEKTIEAANDSDISMGCLNIFLYANCNKSLTMSRHESVENAIQAAMKAQAGDPGTPLFRAKNLIRAGINFLETLPECGKNRLERSNEINFLWEYFYYYSDLTLLNEDSENSCRIVFLALLDAPFIVVAAALSAALAAGCSVILCTHEKSKHFSLESNCEKSWLAKLTQNKDFTGKIQKVVFFGNRSAAQDIYLNSSSFAFSFLCSNNTSAMILESCDVSSAVEKIVSETWDPDSVSMWAVSTVVVQESIYNKFLEKLKFKINQLMIEKKNHPWFKDHVICERLNKIITEAVKGGASIEEFSDDKDKWGPTVIVHYQDQYLESDLPVLKVLVCRTAKEGVALANNTRYCLGTSIWTEISSQALQVASMLMCKNIWINCHGVIDPHVPLQPCGFSGDFVFGGHSGIIEFMSPQLNNTITGNDTKEENSSPDKLAVLEIVQMSQNALGKWQLKKNKRPSLKVLANGLMISTGMLTLDENDGAYVGDIYSEECSSTFREDFYVVQRKVPIGVIAIYINTSVTDMKNIAPIITLALGFGNAVILVLKEKNQFLENAAKLFSAKNVLQTIVGSTALIYLASDPNVEAIWISDKHFSSEFFKVLKTHSVKTLKHFWIIPEIFPIPRLVLQRECLKNKVIWLSKVDQFP